MTQTQEAPTIAQQKEMVVLIRPSFKKICGDDACRAAIFNHLLYWIAQKAKGQPAAKVRRGDVYWYGSYGDICSTGLADSWSMWKVRKEIPLMVGSGIMGQRHNPTHGYDRTFQYFFGSDQGKALRDLCEKHDINLLEIGLQADVLHLLKTTNALVESNTCISSKQQIQKLNPADSKVENIRAIPKEHTKDTTKGTDKERETNTPNVSTERETSLSLSQENFSSSDKSELIRKQEERLAARRGAKHA